VIEPELAVSVFVALLLSTVTSAMTTIFMIVANAPARRTLTVMLCLNYLGYLGCWAILLLRKD